MLQKPPLREDQVDVSLGGIASRAGTLEPGKAADIVVVNGDPLADLTALANVRLVLRDGSIIRQ